MDFSEVYGGGPVSWAPDSSAFAAPSGHRLIVRDADSLAVIQVFSCADEIQQVAWAPDSQYILCALHRRAIIQVFNISDPDWKCRIDEGPVGLAHARWSPDGRNIISTSDSNLRVTVWSLITRGSTVFKFPKHPHRGIAFSHSGKWMAVAERRQSKDYVSLYACASWELVKHFAVDTRDLVDIAWSPDDRAIAIWDSPLEYNVQLYSPDGRSMGAFRAYEDALGVKTAAWSPSAQFFAVGSFDAKVRLLNNLTWRVLATLEHPAQIEAPSSGQPPPVVYREVNIESGGTTRYVVDDLPARVPKEKTPDRPNPPVGVSWLAWSPDGSMLFTRNDAMPRVLWIWGISTLSLVAVIVQQSTIRAAHWDPAHPRLALVTGEGKVFLWSRAGCSCVQVPAVGFRAGGIQWSPSGLSMILTDGDRLCMTWPEI